MIKITAVLPYKELGDLFREMFESHHRYINNIENEDNEFGLEVIINPDVKEVCKYKIDSDVIVARGYTATELRNINYHIPVVEIPVTGHDLIRDLYAGKKRLGKKKIAVIGSINMIMGIETLSDIIDLDIKSYTFLSNSEIKDKVNIAIGEGREVVMGGANTCSYAEEMGLDTILIRTGREAILYAISEAKRVAFMSRREQAKALRFKTILDYAYEGIIAVDNKNVITVFNSGAEKTLGIIAQKEIGRRLDEIVPKSKFSALINTENEYKGEIVKYNNVQIAINRVPIILKGEKAGAVITFQDVTRIQEMESKIREKIYTRGHVAKHTFEDIIGESKKIKDTIQTAKRFSLVDSNILIVGDTGTGKELFTQSIHNYSQRKKGPFVAVNCAALPENLLESELFGYVEGAFTGAVKGGKPGLFELAHKGTIFLDEISEISLKLQGRLLRVIQEKEIMRLGHDRVIPVDVRIISATNKDLYELAQKGDFREDLYYRLDILKINLPSLKERREDILIIAENFIKNYAELFSRGDIIITQKAKEKLHSFDWPGNIRELRNICERLVVLNQGNIITEKEIETVLPKRNSLKPDTDGEKNLSSADKEHDFLEEMKNFEKNRIKETLKKVGYNKIKAAESLGVSRTTLWRKMKDFGIDTDIES